MICHRRSLIIIYLLHIILFLNSTQSYEFNEINFELRDGNVSAGVHIPYNNSIDNSVDFGFLGNGTISGHIWIDENFNKILDEDINLFGIDQADVKLQMYNNISGNWFEARRNVTTNDTGYYQFENLFAGRYRFVVDIYKSSAIDMAYRYDRTTPEYDTVFLENDNSSKTVDIGYEETG